MGRSLKLCCSCAVVLREVLYTRRRCGEEEGGGRREGSVDDNPKEVGERTRYAPLPCALVLAGAKREDAGWAEGQHCSDSAWSPPQRSPALPQLYERAQSISAYTTRIMAAPKTPDAGLPAQERDVPSNSTEVNRVRPPTGATVRFAA